MSTLIRTDLVAARVRVRRRRRRNDGEAYSFSPSFCPERLGLIGLFRFVRASILTLMILNCPIAERRAWQFLRAGDGCRR